MNFTVFCSSSDAVDDVYFQHARELGRLIGEQDGTLVYGGTSVGLMACVSESVQKAGGKTIGVIPEFMLNKGIGNDVDDERIVMPDMCRRKQEMEQLGDVYIALPGGFGTLEEMLEIIVLKQLRIHRKPIVFINTNGFYDPLSDFFSRLVSDKFAKPESGQAIHLSPDPIKAMKYIESYVPTEIPTKWFRPVETD